jgi:hypothetical protein
MAYNTKQLEKLSIEAVKKHNLFFITDIPAFLPCSTATFYNHELEKLESIKEALNENKIKVKSSMRSKWYKSDSATLQIALMKLISNNEERKRLSKSYVDITSDDEKLKALTDVPQELKESVNETLKQKARSKPRITAESDSGN